jgi:hypothetical protein
VNKLDLGSAAGFVALPSVSIRVMLDFEVLQETPWVTGNPPIRETAGHHGANRPEPE